MLGKQVMGGKQMVGWAAVWREVECCRINRYIHIINIALIIMSPLPMKGDILF